MALIPGLALDCHDAGIPWRETSTEGVSWLLLAREQGQAEGASKATGGATVLIRMSPGRGYPPHRHLDVEEVLVLAGGYRDADGEYPAGSYVRYSPGSEHAPVALGDPGRRPGPDNPACVLYATARGGIEALSEPGR